MNEKLIRKLGLLGILSFLSYAAAVVFSPLGYPGYHWVSQAVSDLSADSAPSRVLWNQLAALYMPCGIVCVTLCCVSIQNHYNRMLRIGTYTFAAMSWISAVGYSMFPLMDAGISGRFQDAMHLMVTMMVVILSILSLMMIVFGGLIQKESAALGSWALIALVMMILGGVGTAILPNEYFGIPERLSVFSVSGFTAVLGVYQYGGWKGEKKGSDYDLKEEPTGTTGKTGKFLE